MVQAGACRPRLAIAQRPGAGGQSKHPVCLVHRLLNGVAAHIGTDIPGAVLRLLMGHAQAGIGRRRYPDIVIALVVLEQNVVFGTVLLDERTLQHQRLKLAAHYDIVKMIHMRHHLAHLFGVVGIRAEILAHPIFQFFCLADINNAIGGILHNIYAGLQRQRHRLLPQGLQLGLDHSITSSANISGLSCGIAPPRRYGACRSPPSRPDRQWYGPPSAAGHRHGRTAPDAQTPPAAACRRHR